jgi:hypothetical protein
MKNAVEVHSGTMIFVPSVIHFGLVKQFESKKGVEFTEITWRLHNYILF